MIDYAANGQTFEIDRDLISDARTKYNEDLYQVALSKAGYINSFLVGVRDTASIELFSTSNSEYEYVAMALLRLGGVSETYVFSSARAAHMFMKEFVPMIESVLNANRLADDR